MVLNSQNWTKIKEQNHVTKLQNYRVHSLLQPYMGLKFSPQTWVTSADKTWYKNSVTQENSECLQENKIRVFWIQCLQTTDLVLECVFRLCLGIVDKSNFTKDFSFQLTIVICFYAFLETQVFAPHNSLLKFCLPLWLKILPMWLLTLRVLIVWSSE